MTRISKMSTQHHYANVNSKVTLHSDSTAAKVNVVGSASQNMEGYNSGWLGLLSDAISAFVQEVNESNLYGHIIVGDNIEDHLFKVCQHRFRNNRVVADKLNIPVSTARRKILKALDNQTPVSMPESWRRVSSLLEQLVTSDLNIKGLMHVLKHQVVRQVLRNNSQTMKHAAAQIGVSEPTLYKLKRKLNELEED